MNEILATAIAYAVGSMPVGVLLTSWRGVDLRQVGSRNVGAANVLRTSGVGLAVTTACLDIAKGCCAVAVARGLAAGEVALVVAGLASVIGHVYPVWFGFRGGKGVATAAGVFAMLAPVALAVSAGVFVIVVWFTRLISLGSITATIVLIVIAALGGSSVAVVTGAVVVGAIIIHRHMGNLARLRAGTEHRLGQPAS